MVILIGGNSCTGKTLMSQKLLEKYKIPYFSMDHLKMGIFRSNQECGFTPLDSSEEIGKKIWPILWEMIKTAIENDQNMIIEGCYLLPHMIKDFDKDYLEKIIAVFLGFSREYLENNFLSNVIKFNRVIESRGPEERPLSQFIEESLAFRNKCIKNDVNYFEIDQDFETEMNKVYEFIHQKFST